MALRPSADIAAENFVAGGEHGTAAHEWNDAIAVLNIIFGGVGILNGLYLVLGAFALMLELLRLDVFAIPAARLAFAFLILATGIIVGLIAGIGIFALRPWASALSLVYGSLLIFSSALSFFAVPIIASIGTYDIGSLSADGLTRLIIFGVIYVVFPAPYAFLLYVVFYKPAWKTTFAKGSASLTSA
jgi:hypothetical protein